MAVFNALAETRGFMVTTAVVFIGLVLFVICLLQVVGLPGNWIVLALVFLWKLLGPSSSAVDLTWTFIIVMVAIAAVGELLEWGIQIRLGSRFGSSSKGNWGGIIGSIIGGILFLPLFFGFGAILGALAGAYVGCLIVELACRRNFKEANIAAWGVFVGRFLGMALKLGIGIAIVVFSVWRMWP